jgi:hypothetical protein
MPTSIFHRETNAHEEWLDVEDDGSLTYHIENSGWPALKAGVCARETTLTAAEAKVRWPSYGPSIDAAVNKRKG